MKLCRKRAEPNDAVKRAIVTASVVHVFIGRVGYCEYHISRLGFSLPVLFLERNLL